MSDHGERPTHRQNPLNLTIYWSLAALAVCGVLLFVFWEPIYGLLSGLCQDLMDKEAFRARVESYGAWAPVAFIGLQIFQVLVSPVPGELVGAVGGYIFGWAPSLIYSTIGLSLGSWINFFLARLLGEALVLRLVPEKFMAKVAAFMERQGVIASLLFFVVPGFPKDYFSYVLGLTPMSWRVFLVISSVGRIPGTLMLSLQGALVYEERYWTFIVLGAVSLAFLIPVYLWRDRIYNLLSRLDGLNRPSDRN